MKTQIDWAATGQAAFYFAAGLFGAYTMWKNNRAEKARKELAEALAETKAHVKATAEKTDAISVVVDKTDKKVDHVQTQTDGYLSGLLQIGMTSALALAVASPKPENQALADVAVKAYKDHKEQLDKVENGKTP